MLCFQWVQFWTWLQSKQSKQEHQLLRLHEYHPNNGLSFPSLVALGRMICIVSHLSPTLVALGPLDSVLVSHSGWPGPAWFYACVPLGSHLSSNMQYFALVVHGSGYCGRLWFSYIWYFFLPVISTSTGQLLPPRIVLVISLFLSLYIYIHNFIHIHTSAPYIYIYIYIYIYTYTYIYIHIHIYIYIYIYIRIIVVSTSRSNNTSGMWTQAACWCAPTACSSSDFSLGDQHEELGISCDLPTGLGSQGMILWIAVYIYVLYIYVLYIYVLYIYVLYIYVLYTYVLYIYVLYIYVLYIYIFTHYITYICIYIYYYIYKTNQMISRWKRRMTLQMAITKPRENDGWPVDPNGVA